MTREHVIDVVRKICVPHFSWKHRIVFVVITHFECECMQCLNLITEKIAWKISFDELCQEIAYVIGTSIFVVRFIWPATASMSNCRLRQLYWAISTKRKTRGKYMGVCVFKNNWCPNHLDAHRFRREKEQPPPHRWWRCCLAACSLLPVSFDTTFFPFFRNRTHIHICVLCISQAHACTHNMYVWI